MREFITSDLHFGHKNIIKYENRPFETIEEMDEYLINLWNKTVNKDDFVYILGDFSWYGVAKTAEILDKLNGRKILIIGNHDCNYLDKKDFDKSLFEEICYYKEIKRNKKLICMMHYPIANWNNQERGSIHLFGHVHTMDNDAQKFMLNQDNCYNVCYDVHKKILNLEDIL